MCYTSNVFGTLRSRAGVGYDTVYDYKFSIWTSSIAQLAQDLDSIFVCPVMDYAAHHEDSWALYWLWCKEVVCCEPLSFL